MAKSQNNKYILLMVYYLLLVLLFMSWTNADSAPGSIARLGFLAALLVPAYIIEKRILPAVMALFLSASTHGYSTSYMPSMMYTYVVLLPLGLVFFQPERAKERNAVIKLLLFLLLYVTIVNLFTTFDFQGITQALIIVMCLLYYVDFRDEMSLHIMSCAFMVASIMLSYNLIRFGGALNSVTMFNEERTGFHDINYSACVVSLGCMTAIVELFKNTKRKLILILSIITLAISVTALSMNASRASFLSIIVTFLIMAVTSNTRLTYKVLIIIVVSCGIWYLYTNDYFDLLVKRIEMDEGRGGTGRTEIWSIKFKAFIYDSNILQLLFGWGYTGGRDLAMDRLKVYGFHNDYLAFLVEYGIVGAFLFFRMYFLPLWQSLKKHNNFIVVAALTSGLFVICLTLEPFAAGRVPYFFFWLYILWWAKMDPDYVKE